MADEMVGYDPVTDTLAPLVQAHVDADTTAAIDARIAFLGGGGGGSFVEDPAGTGFYMFTGTPTVTGVAPVFTASAPPAGAVGQVYSYRFLATGAPGVIFDVPFGAVPIGLALDSTGLLTGTPTTQGSAAFTVRASNGVSPAATVVCTVAVAPGSTAPVFTAAIPPGATVGTAYSYQFGASGTAPIVYTLNSGSLPAGLTLSSAGLLSGTPTTAATATFTVLASNGVSPAAVSGTKTVVVAASGGGGSPSLLLDFTTGDFTQWPNREFKDAATSADMARQQQIVTTPAGSGYTYLAKFDVISTDATSGDTGRNRSEVTNYTNDGSGSNGTTTWWAWKMYLPAGFHVDSDAASPVGNGWLIFSQWHSDGSGPGPNVAFELTKGTSAPQIIFETSGNSGGSEQAYWVQPTPIPLGSWVTFVVGITWGETSSTGRVTVIVNGLRWLNNVAAATLYTGQYAYFKQGIYRAQSAQDQSIIIAGTRRGPTEASVTF